MPAEYIIGLDLGELNDYTALAVMSKVTRIIDPGKLTGWQIPPGGGAIEAAAIRPIRTPTKKAHHFEVVHLERPPIATRYPVIVQRVTELLREPRLKGATLAVDRTGVGQAVVDQLLAAGLKPIEVSIHGGDAVHREGRSVRVPKRDLVAAVSVALQNERLKVATSLPLAPVLVQELLNFRVKLDPTTAHDSYGCWRDGQHDDLVLGVALGVWVGEHWPKPARLHRFDAEGRYLSGSEW